MYAACGNLPSPGASYSMLGSALVPTGDPSLVKRDQTSSKACLQRAAWAPAASCVCEQDLKASGPSPGSPPHAPGVHSVKVKVWLFVLKSGLLRLLALLLV